MGPDAADVGRDTGSTADAPAEAALPDTGPSCADAGYDGRAWGVGDFASYRWSFVGTGVSDSFFMDRDCGIDAQDLAGGDARSGVVAAGDCNDFKALAVSSRELGALSSACTCMPRATDDEENTRVELVGGAVYGRHTSGCEETEPFHSTITKMYELESKYLSRDAGPDSLADAATD